MKITEQELTRRLAEADTRIVALRRATLELLAAGQRILKQRNETGSRRRSSGDRPVEEVRMEKVAIEE